MTHHVTVVGIGEDGWNSLTAPAQEALSGATLIIGSPRQLALLPEDGRVRARRELLPSPLHPGLERLVAHPKEPLCLLASGDPLFHGIGATVARWVPAALLTIIPQVSSVALACARLGWDRRTVSVLSLVSQPVEVLHPAVQPSARLVVLSRDGSTPAEVADLLNRRGFGPSELTVLERVGGPREQQVFGHAESWPHGTAADLNVVAVDCRPGPGAEVLSRNGGLPDDAYEHDGQITKQEVRAVAVAALAPAPGQLLWDIGAGSGSIGIEWMRLDPSSRAIAVEAQPERAERITRNSYRLGVPGLQVVEGKAPKVLAGLPRPDAVFVGGGLTVPGMFEAVWDALPPGGRLVANAVTLETEALLVRRQAELGGELVRLAVSRAGALGGFTAWRPQLPVTLWKVLRP